MVRLFCDMKASRGMLLVALALSRLQPYAISRALVRRCRGVRLTTSPTSIVPGAALDRGADPYRYEPLHRCEHAVNSARPTAQQEAASFRHRFRPRLSTLHARGESELPIARVIDALTIAAAVAASIGARFGNGSARRRRARASLACGLRFAQFRAGRPVCPGGARLLRRCAGASARSAGRPLRRADPIEPHLGLPVCAAMLCWVTRSRPGVLATALALAGLGLLIVGGSG